MRAFVISLAVTSIAAAGAGQDRFTLGLAELPLATAPATAGEPGTGVVAVTGGLELEAISEREGLVYQAALTPTSEREFRLALWDSPMGRLHYARAEQESMLGREGLVGGGRMIGLGMATTALGDGDPGGLQVMMRHRWSELTLGDKVQAGIEASFLAALIYYMAEYAD